MTSSLPDEAIHFRGETLTPESPRPQRAPEPANIPLLQNQMDPVFDDTSAFERPESVTGNTPAPDKQVLQRTFGVAGDAVEQLSYMNDTNSFQSASAQVEGSTGHNDSTLAASATNYFPSSQPSLNVTTDTLTAWNAAIPYQTNGQSDPTALLSGAISGNTYQAPSISLNSPLLLPERSPGATAGNRTKSDSAPYDHRDDQIAGDGAKTRTGDSVDLKNVLNSLSHNSASAVTDAASSADNFSVTAATTDNASLGLPPRPPPQEKASIHPNYSPIDHIRAYHRLPLPNLTLPTTYPAQKSSDHLAFGLAGAQGTTSSSSTLPPPPPPPVANFLESLTPVALPQESEPHAGFKEGWADRQIGQYRKAGDEDSFWGPEVQKEYDEFLHNERIYVSEGRWDRFAPGSRLFVGNLPTEKITKRDLFHIFHKYGKLAQVSIKQAYGFIQFLDPQACSAALRAEHGAIVRGRRIHLEVSKPQKSVRPESALDDGPKSTRSRRSRSPDFGRNHPGSRGPRSQRDRHPRPHESGRAPVNNYRDDHSHRRSDDHWAPRSPSPRGFRGREKYRRSRDRSLERSDRWDRRRFRSPYGDDDRTRSPSPRAHKHQTGDLDIVTLPRRALRDVPDVQILVLEELDRNFISYVEMSLRNRGVRTDVLTLGPRIPLSAAIRRQMAEGVLAVVKLSRSSQYSGKISLQVVDRTGDQENPHSYDYPELDVNIAVEVVVQILAAHHSGLRTLNNPTLNIPQLSAAQAPLQPVLNTMSQPSNIPHLLSPMNGPNLQSLLSSLQQQSQPSSQPTQQPFPAANMGAGVDLASLLSNVTRQGHPVAPVQTSFKPSLQQQSFPLQMPNASVAPDQNLVSLLTKGLGGQQAQGQGPGGPDIHKILNQLAGLKH